MAGVARDLATVPCVAFHLPVATWPGTDGRCGVTFVFAGTPAVEPRWVGNRFMWPADQPKNP